MGPAKSIALVVCDIDGTLVRHDKTLADASIAAFGRLRRAGVQASLISARPPSGMLWLAEALDISLPLGAFNGGTLFRRDGGIMSSTHLSASAAKTALALLADAGVDAWLFARGRWYARDADNPRVPRERLSTAIEPTLVADLRDHADGTDKIVGVSEDGARLADVEARIKAALGDAVTAGLSQTYFLDVTCAAANKGVGVTAIAAAAGVPLDRVAVIGDMRNDLAMFSRAGLSIAMGQSQEPVRAAADLVTASSDDDGVAAAIDRFILPRAVRPAADGELHG